MNTTFSAAARRSARLVLLPGLLAAAACETVVDLPEPPHTPRLALQYTLSNTPPTPRSNNSYVYEVDILASRQLFVSNSQRVFDTRPLNGRTDATVEIRDEQGRVVETFRPNTNQSNPFAGRGSYEPTMGLLGEPGRTYSLRASAPGFEPVESTLTLPTAPIITAASYVPRPPVPGDYLNSFRGRLSVTVADDPATTDYYLVFARVLDKQGKAGAWSSVRTDYEDGTEGDLGIDQFQLSDSGNGYGIHPYADADVNGKPFSLNANVEFYEYSSSCQNCADQGYLEVIVSKITPDAYRFYLAQRRYNEANGNPFAEPAPLTSNIQKGYGLFGGAIDTAYRIKLF